MMPFRDNFQIRHAMVIFTPASIHRKLDQSIMMSFHHSNLKKRQSFKILKMSVTCVDCHSCSAENV